jgi:hypothetical protein
MCDKGEIVWVVSVTGLMNVAVLRAFPLQCKMAWWQPLMEY